MDRMSPLDEAFWHLEDTHASLHIGSVAIFTGPAPSSAEIFGLYASKLPQVPRLRQKMRIVPFALGLPVWVDDEHFDLSYHLHRRALTVPATQDDLCRAVGQLMSTHLDRARPLWEVWVIEGLEDEHWALVTKVHHSMIDGVSGMDLLSTILDSSPDAQLAPLEHWTPRSEPGAATLVAGALLDQVRSAGGALGRISGAGRHPRRAGTTALAATRGLVGFAPAARPVTATSLTGPIGSLRRYRMVSADIADVAQVKSQLGGTVNDVVLAIVTRGFRDLLLGRGHDPGPHSVRCLVPVSVRGFDDHGRVGNRVSALIANLPVEFADPVTTYGAVRARMQQLKASHEDVAAELITDLARYVAPQALAVLMQLALRLPQHALSTVITNVPGSRHPLYALGRRLLANYPYVPIADRVRIGVAVTSYDGRLFFGITGDKDSVPDIDVLTAGIEDALTELTKQAELTG